MEMINSEKLIREIEKHNVLYDRSVKDYYNKNVKHLVWNKVCAVVYPIWNQLNDLEKCNYLIYAQTRWRSIRDSFIKCLYKTKSNTKYLYYEQMEFLIPFLAAQSNPGKSSPLSTEIDSDRMFMLSLLPHMHNIPFTSKLEAKSELLEILKNYSNRGKVTIKNEPLEDTSNNYIPIFTETHTNKTNINYETLGNIKSEHQDEDDLQEKIENGMNVLKSLLEPTDMELLETSDKPFKIECEEYDVMYVYDNSAESDSNSNDEIDIG